MNQKSEVWEKEDVIQVKHNQITELETKNTRLKDVLPRMEKLPWRKAITFKRNT